MASTEDDYDKLSKEEKEAHDKADRAREKEEQAGKNAYLSGHCALMYTFVSLQLFLTHGSKN